MGDAPPVYAEQSATPPSRLITRFEPRGTDMRRISKRSVAVLAGTAVIVAGAGVAFAFWTAGGSGTGTAITGAGTSPLTAVQTSTVADLRPGGAAQNLSGNFTNPAANGPVYVTSVTASISSVVKAGGAVAGTCDATDYTLANAVMDVNAEVPTGTAQGAWGVPADVATLAFNNKATNQDQCKGATVNLAYAIV
jgi:hypothetical protein